MGRHYARCSSQRFQGNRCRSISARTTIRCIETSGQPLVGPLPWIKSFLWEPDTSIALPGDAPCMFSPGAFAAAPETADELSGNVSDIPYYTICSRTEMTPCVCRTEILAGLPGSGAQSDPFRRRGCNLLHTRAHVLLFATIRWSSPCVLFVGIPSSSASGVASYFPA
jgi:hypothetical protein